MFVELGWARGFRPCTLTGRDGFGAGVCRLALVVFLVHLLFYVLATSYFAARCKTWCGPTRATCSIRFKSRLRLPALAALTAKNTLLLALTLGLYWPFAFIVMTRLRLRRFTCTPAFPWMLCWRTTRGPVGETAGDAAGDIFGAAWACEHGLCPTSHLCQIACWPNT